MASYGGYHFGTLNGIFKSIKKLADRSRVFNDRLTKVEANVKGLPVGTILTWSNLNALPESESGGGGKMGFLSRSTTSSCGLPRLI